MYLYYYAKQIMLIDNISEKIIYMSMSHDVPNDVICFWYFRYSIPCLYDYELEYVNNNIMNVIMYMEYTRHYERSASGITDTQAL